MVLRKLVNRILSSTRFRALWQSNVFGIIVRFVPPSSRQRLRSIYRGILVTPRVPPLAEQGDVDLWDHSKPILSVVIPCHNYGLYIREALKSLESQTFKDFETIIVDDGSSDEETLNVLDELRHEGFRVLRQERLNVSTALNHGILVARGRYVCCFAADDMLEPTYFEKCLCHLESNPGLAFAYSLVRTFGDENRVWFTEPFDLRVLLEYNHICGTALFRRIAWEKVGGFDEQMDGYEDWDFWIKVGKAGFRGSLIPEILFNYRRHGITVNLRADRKSQRLIKHIRSTNAELFSHPEEIRNIQESYRDVRTTQPFLNLSSKTQYSRSNEPHVILITSSQTVVPGKVLDRLSSGVERENGSHLILVETCDTPYQEVEHHRSISVRKYALSRFLDRYCWLDFLLNLIETRSALLVIISNSKLAYEWVPTIKARTSAPLVDIIHDETSDFSRLSARYDPFIDLHLAFSEDAMNSLAREFDICTKKIHLFSKMPRLDKFTDQLQVLAQRRQ